MDKDKERNLIQLIKYKLIVIIVLIVCKFPGKWTYGRYYLIMKRKNYIKNKLIK